MHGRQHWARPWWASASTGKPTFDVLRAALLPALVVILVYWPVPARSQSPVFDEAGVPLDCPECSTLPHSYFGHDILGFYVQSGAVVPLGDGFLEERLETGWTVQVGMREVLCCPGPGVMLFQEFGGHYAANGGDNVPLVFSGFFQGLDPPDDHVHEFDELITTRLIDIQRVGWHYALGGYWRLLGPYSRNAPETRLKFRSGIRAGALQARFQKTTNPDVIAGVAEHFDHGHARVELSTDGGEDPELFFGVFVDVGLEIACHEVCSAGRRRGTLFFGADVEFAHDWFDLGDYGEGDDGLGSFTPMLSMLYSY